MSGVAGRAYYGFQRLRSIIRLIFLRWTFGTRFRVGTSVGVRRQFVLNISTPEARLAIGDHCSFNNNCSINVRQAVTIGNDCIVGENVRIYDHDHRFRTMSEPIRLQGFQCSPVTVEANCWIGSNVTILKGVTVGTNSVIGAGVVLSKDVPANSIVTMSPGLRVRSRLES